MKVFIYSSKAFELPYLQAAATDWTLTTTPERLTMETAGLAKGYAVVSVFTADDVSEPVLRLLKQAGVQFIALRAAGHDNVDVEAAARLGITVARVPAYSPYAVAEHVIALVQALNRKIVLADQRVHHQNFLLDELIGFDLHGKTVGIVGTGRIGRVLARILRGFGCQLLGYDVHFDRELVDSCDLRYVPLEDLCRRSDIISLHVPLVPPTFHLIHRTLIHQMKRGVLLINTSRGGVVDTEDVIEGVLDGTIGGYGADVYENESGIFFSDWSNRSLNDGLLRRLLLTPHVLLTPHQGFATREALQDIARTTVQNIRCWEEGTRSGNELQPEVAQDPGLPVSAGKSATTGAPAH